MKRMVVGAALLAAAPFCAQAQSLQSGGVYVGLEGGANWMFNSTFNTQAVVNPFFNQGFQTTATWNTGYVLGGTVGYDFVGPRVELEGAYRNNYGNLQLTGFNNTAGINFQQTSVMGNVYYDFLAGSRFVPYVGAGAGVSFLNAGALGTTVTSTQFAYQAMIGAGYNLDETFRINLEGRYFGTTTPNFTHTGTFAGNAFSVTTSPSNNNISLMACPADALRCAGRGSAAAAAAAAGCAVVHGVLRLGPLEPLAAGADHDRAGGRRPSRPRAMPASRRPATPTRRARKPTTWRCRCVARTRSRMRWCVTACRRRRSR